MRAMNDSRTACRCAEDTMIRITPAVTLAAICLASSPALARPQGVAEACRSVKASSDLANGDYIVMKSVCTRGKNYSPENCLAVASASDFASSAAIRENRKCKAALDREAAAGKP
jgi:hypothetical protein